ncbi:hypothetical protein PENSPDRAFT_583044 [Peniophora sp. CONT]|nr:hypothetical protein PENSPDRAFT_583044 [Peniophora sp. CONT]
MAFLETPSRIMRRFDAQAGMDMPSLPSLPAFDEESGEEDEEPSTSEASRILSDDEPLQSTPAPSSAQNTARLGALQSSACSTARFAHSLASRTSRSQLSSQSQSLRRSTPNDLTFNDVSPIAARPRFGGGSGRDLSESGSGSGGFSGGEGDSVGDELSLSDALRDLSRTSSARGIDTPQSKKREYTGIGLSPSVKVAYDIMSPLDKMRHITARKPLPPLRTPSLSRTTPSPTNSSPANSTPRSTISQDLPAAPTLRFDSPSTVPLPPSQEPSPANVRWNRSTSEASSGSPAEDETHHAQSQSNRQSLREPTFSSEEPATPQSALSLRSALAASPAPGSSATPSTLYTPTPAAIQPRPRARFGNITSTTPAAIPETPRVGPGHGLEDDFTTPFARRRSFLMDVINSTARPRFAQPTPHPRHGVMDTPLPRAISEEPELESGGSGGGRQSHSQQTSQSPGSGQSQSSGSLGSGGRAQSVEPEEGDGDVTQAPTGRLPSAFVGLTPGPRPRVRRGAGRLSHPLTRTWAPEPSDAGADDNNSEADYNERPSFASTASSHDLAIHARANASYDPATGTGGLGLGRFDAAKLNAYLHGLNRRLQEESESLAGQVEMLKGETLELAEENAVLAMELEEARRAGRRGSGGGRGGRVSDIATSLQGVQEDVGGEGWMEEKIQLEEELENARSDAERLNTAYEQAARDLEEEQAGRTADKEKFRERMGEVERGVQGIIHELESKVEKAEARAAEAAQYAERIREMERELKEERDARAFEHDRAERAEEMLASRQDLGGELHEVNERLATAHSETRAAQSQVADLESELERLTDQLEDAQTRAQDERDNTRKLQEELDAREANLSSMEHHVGSRETALQQLEQELAEAREYIAELEAEGNAVVDRVEALEAELADEREQLAALDIEKEQMDRDMARVQEESERNAELARQMEDALDVAEKKGREDEAALHELQRKISHLERERSRIDLSHSVNVNPQSSPEELAELEAELDEAYRRIGQLEAQLSQSPAREALEKAREARIEMLERERDELGERVKSYAKLGMGTPGKMGGMLGNVTISPMHRAVLNMTMHAPRTPGAPLRDMSWLHPSTSDASISPYMSEIKRLQSELDKANEEIDSKLDKLNDVRFGAVELTQQLEEERQRSAALEDDMARLERREERRMKRLERVKCAKCKTKVDVRGLGGALDADESSIDASMFSMVSEQPSKSSETLKAELRNVNKELTLMKKQWLEEKRQLLGDKAVLQDAASKLDSQVREAERRVGDMERAGDRVRLSSFFLHDLQELDEAKRTIAELENELKAQRTRMRTLTTEQSRAERDRESVLMKLKRTESEIVDVKNELQRLKLNNNELESELRMNDVAEKKARLLEARSNENADTIEQLRHERSQLASEHKHLQERYREANERLNKLREENAATQHSLDDKRHALDLRLLDIADLNAQLADSDAAVSAAQTQARAVAELEGDLSRVRRAAEALGRDLRAERSAREEEIRQRKAVDGKQRKELEEAKRVAEKAERARKQVGSEVRVLRERIGALEGEKKGWDAHQCTAYVSQLVALRSQHKLESKGLIVQINYLKAKFTRENTLRIDLSYQKRYLLVLLARHERGDEKVLAAIARIGFGLPNPSPKAKRKTLRSVAQSVVFLQRVKRASDAWRKECEAKPAIKAALDDVRRRRAREGQSRHAGPSS